MALKQRIEDMQERHVRLRTRFEKKRGLACWAMTSADIDKILEQFPITLARILS